MIPPLVYALWNSLRDPRRKGTSLLSLTATTTYSGRCGEIVPGQIVLYSAVKPGAYQQIEGQVIAVSDGQQVVFGEATLEGQTVVVNGKPYPPHLNSRGCLGSDETPTHSWHAGYCPSE